jgi:restriction endonuclease Mrr
MINVKFAVKMMNNVVTEFSFIDFRNQLDVDIEAALFNKSKDIHYVYNMICRNIYTIIDELNQELFLNLK